MQEVTPATKVIAAHLRHRNGTAFAQQAVATCNRHAATIEDETSVVEKFKSDLLGNTLLAVENGGVLKACNAKSLVTRVETQALVRDCMNDDDITPLLVAHNLELEATVRASCVPSNSSPYARLFGVA